MRSVSSAAAVGHHPHQLDAAARAVVLVAQLGEGRATRRTQPAVNAAQEQIVADARGRVRRVRRIRVVEVVAVHVEYESAGIQNVLRIEPLFDRPHDADVLAGRAPDVVADQLAPSGCLQHDHLAAGRDGDRAELRNAG